MAIRYVNVGAVRVFDHVAPDRQQALKPLEEAAEVFGAWQLMEGIEDTGVREKRRLLLLDECADVIQATLNLVAALRCDDIMPCGGDACGPFSINEARCICGILRDILRRVRALRKAEIDED